MRIEPPEMPLSREAFAAALRKGHGRALQHIARFGRAGLEAEIVESCVTNQAYDPQIDEDRAPWLFEVVKNAGLEAQIFEVLARCARNPSVGGHWDATQRCGIAKHLAADGYPGARELLYSMFARWPNSGDVLAADEIVSLDGAAGLVHLAREEGRWLAEDPEFWVDSSMIELADKVEGQPVAADALRSAAVSDPDIARYLAAALESHASTGAPPARPRYLAFSAQEVLEYVASGTTDRCVWLRGWGRRASRQEIEVLFEALLQEQNAERATKLLRTFAEVGAPRFDECLVKWVRHAEPTVRWAATRALRGMRAPRVRQIGLEMLANGDVETAAHLLVANYEVGDFERLLAVFTPDQEPPELHDVCQGLLNLCESHLTDEALETLVCVYEYTPCSWCRRLAAKALFSLPGVPSWIREEARKDADPGTRALAANGVP